MKQRIAVLGIFWFAGIASLVIIFAIIFNQPVATNAAAGCQSSFGEPGTHENLCAFNVPEGASEVSIPWSAELQQGGITWTLTGPDGSPAWQHSAEGQAVEDEYTLLAPQAGRWELSIKTDQAQGSYNFGWNVK